MPNQIGPHLEQRIIAFALGHPGFGRRRISAELAREKWGGLRISEHGVWRVLVRVGLNATAASVTLSSTDDAADTLRPESRGHLTGSATAMTQSHGGTSALEP